MTVVMTKKLISSIFDHYDKNNIMSLFSKSKGKTNPLQNLISNIQSDDISSSTNLGLIAKKYQPEFEKILPLLQKDFTQLTSEEIESIKSLRKIALSLLSRLFDPRQIELKDWFQHYQFLNLCYTIAPEALMINRSKLVIEKTSQVILLIVDISGSLFGYSQDCTVFAPWEILKRVGEVADNYKDQEIYFAIFAEKIPGPIGKPYVILDPHGLNKFINENSEAGLRQKWSKRIREYSFDCYDNQVRKIDVGGTSFWTTFFDLMEHFKDKPLKISILSDGIPTDRKILERKNKTNGSNIVFDNIQALDLIIIGSWGNVPTSTGKLPRSEYIKDLQSILANSMINFNLLLTYVDDNDKQKLRKQLDYEKIGANQDYIEPSTETLTNLSIIDRLDNLSGKGAFFKPSDESSMIILANYYVSDILIVSLGEFLRAGENLARLEITEPLDEFRAFVKNVLTSVTRTITTYVDSQNIQTASRVLHDQLFQKISIQLPLFRNWCRKQPEPMPNVLQVFERSYVRLMNLADKKLKEDIRGSQRKDFSQEIMTKTFQGEYCWITPPDNLQLKSFYNSSSISGLQNIASFKKYSQQSSFLSLLIYLNYHQRTNPAKKINADGINNHVKNQSNTQELNHIQSMGRPINLSITNLEKALGYQIKGISEQKDNGGKDTETEDEELKKASQFDLHYGYRPNDLAIPIPKQFDHPQDLINLLKLLPRAYHTPATFNLLNVSRLIWLLESHYQMKQIVLPDTYAKLITPGYLLTTPENYYSLTDLSDASPVNNDIAWVKHLLHLSTYPEFETLTANYLKYSGKDLSSENTHNEVLKLRKIALSKLIGYQINKSVGNSRIINYRERIDGDRAHLLFDTTKKYTYQEFNSILLLNDKNGYPIEILELLDNTIEGRDSSRLYYCGYPKTHWDCHYFAPEDDKKALYRNVFYHRIRYLEGSWMNRDFHYENIITDNPSLKVQEEETLANGDIVYSINANQLQQKIEKILQKTATYQKTITKSRVTYIRDLVPTVLNKLADLLCETLEISKSDFNQLTQWHYATMVSQEVKASEEYQLFIDDIIREWVDEGTLLTPDFVPMELLPQELGLKQVNDSAIDLDEDTKAQIAKRFKLELRNKNLELPQDNVLSLQEIKNKIDEFKDTICPICYDSFGVYYLSEGVVSNDHKPWVFSDLKSYHKDCGELWQKNNSRSPMTGQSGFQILEINSSLELNLQCLISELRKVQEGKRFLDKVLAENKVTI